MSRKTVNVVWIKRDIRTQDHLPLLMANQSELPFLLLYIFDTDVINYPDTDIRHLRFQYHSLIDIEQRLAPYNIKVHVTYGKTLDIFTDLCTHYDIQNIFSYQETGIQLTYDIDKKVKLLCNHNHIKWIEYQRDGIVRGIKNRIGWDKQWFSTMYAPIVQNTYDHREPLLWQHSYTIPDTLLAQWEAYPSHQQPPGETQAHKYLNSFLKDRHAHYSKHISKPLDSRTSCSRLSPYLAWGNLSIRQVYQLALHYSQSTKYKRPLINFMTRLKWHCHFIQKFETVCAYEKVCINKGYESMTYIKNEDYIVAWKTGQTGYPLVDACMRCVVATGWINFRMRALVVSFLTHHLFQNWKDGVYFLAQQFLDYEPGIHYTQFQMQAGVTGVNTIRVYNPTKNALEHDSEAQFIKKWCPELKHLPSHFAIEPWKLTSMDEVFYNFKLGVHYPSPIISLCDSKTNINTIWQMRTNMEVKTENTKILSQLVRPNSATALQNRKSDEKNQK